MPSIYPLYRFFSSRFRRRRIKWFLEVISPKPESKALDVGGYYWFWLETRVPDRVTLLNPHVIPGLSGQVHDRFNCVVGDGCKLAYADKAFDIVFSNSVIEHVGTYERQQAFAAEARRVGRSLWIQTPARSFFVEPHLLTPFIHFFSRSVQARLIRYFTVWGLMTRPTPAQVEGFLNEVRLLTGEEMQALFPDCKILREKWLGFTKSYVAVRRAA